MKITIVGEVKDEAAASVIWDAFKNGTQLNGLHMTMLGRGDQVTAASEIVEEVANLDADFSIPRSQIKDLVKRAEAAMNVC